MQRTGPRARSSMAVPAQTDRAIAEWCGRNGTRGPPSRRVSAVRRVAPRIQSLPATVARVASFSSLTPQTLDDSVIFAGDNFVAEGGFDYLLEAFLWLQGRRPILISCDDDVVVPHPLIR